MAGINNYLDRKVVLWSTATICICTLLAKSVTWWMENRRKKLKVDVIPTQWRPAGEIDSLILYPLKSGHGNQVDIAECTSAGLSTITENNVLKLHDRVFIAYNAVNNTYKTGLQHSKMVLIAVTGLTDNQVRFTAPGMNNDLQFTVPDSDKSPSFVCSNWLKETVSTIDCGEEAATWISQYLLGKPYGVRLGYHMGDKPEKDVEVLPWSDFKQYYRNLRNDDYGIYSDMTSFMLLGTSSVANLNTRLPDGVKPVSAGHFRPNILVRGSVAYAEDGWDWIKIGDQAIFRGVKPCTRCTFTTIDPETGIKDMEHKEPLKTLKKYRQLKEPGAVKLDGTSPVMGLYMGLHTPGQVKKGDIVYIGVP